jgi:tetratricopeptide (TPR) repeat protein
MNDESYDSIHRFLNNEMSEEERSNFEAGLLKNDILNEAVEFERMLKRLGMSLKSKLDDLDGSNSADNDDGILALIKNARLAWETKNANTNLPDDSFPNYSMGSGSSEQSATGRSVLLSPRRKRMNKYLVAALVTGIIGLSAILLVVNMDRLKLVSNTSKAHGDTLNRQVITDSSKQLRYDKDENIVKVSDSEKSRSASHREAPASSANRQELFAKYFAPDTQSVSAPDILQEPISLYESGKYEQAINAFQNIDDVAITRGDVEEQQLTFFYKHYYKAICLLAEENFSKAIDDFKNAINKSSDNDLTTKAEWYLALAYLGSGNIKNAHATLDRIISNQNGIYFKKAKNLKREITTR